jgi:hypothetical protein
MPPTDHRPVPPFNAESRAGWEAALKEIEHQAAHLEERGATSAGAALREAVRIARAGGLECEHRRTLD